MQHNKNKKEEKKKERNKIFDWQFFIIVFKKKHK